MKKLLLTFILLGSFIGVMVSQNTTTTLEEPLPTSFKLQEQAQFPGGIEKMYDFIQSNLNCQQAAAKAESTEKIYIRLVVEADGSLSDITFISSTLPECNAEAERVIKMMPTWQPAKYNNKAVRVYYNIPIPIPFSSVKK